MAGNQSRGLIAASKTKGWDPTEIPGMGGILPNFDRDQKNYGNDGDKCVGTLPEGTPEAWPDSLGNPPTPSPQAQDFQPQPQASGNENRRTSGADPYKGFGEGGY